MEEDSHIIIIIYNDDGINDSLMEVALQVHIKY